MIAAIQASGTQVITLSTQRQTPLGMGGEVFWQAIKTLNCHLLPNTAGCRDANMAIKSAEIASRII